MTSALSPESSQLVAQPHGGAIRQGNPGNKGGKGRTPSAVRKACRKEFAKRIPDLAKIADNPDIDVKERLKALDMFGRFGLSGAVTWDDIRARLKAQLAILRQYVPPEQLEPLLAELASIWR